MTHLGELQRPPAHRTLIRLQRADDASARMTNAPVAGAAERAALAFLTLSRIMPLTRYSRMLLLNRVLLRATIFSIWAGRLNLLEEEGLSRCWRQASSCLFLVVLSPNGPLAPLTAYLLR